MSYLVIERGKNAGERIEIKSYPTSIGRSRTNHVQIDDVESSREHVRIKKRGRLYILEDLESRNGTYVNGDKVINTTLQSGDKILIGTTELIFLAPEANVHIITEIMNFDLNIDNSIGIKGPIDIKDSHDNSFKAVRLDPIAMANNVMRNTEQMTNLFNYYSNLLALENLDEICNTLLKSIGRLVGNASRAGLFIWSEKSRQLLPYANKNYKSKSPFTLSQRALEDVINRKQGVLILPNTKATATGKTRAILPMIHNSEILALVHIELDDVTQIFRTEELEAAQALLAQTGPIVETHLLRKEVDTWSFGVIDTIISTVEAKDTYTRGHSERVANYSMAVADNLKLQKEVKKNLMISSLCHDIGKIGVPDSILKKASRLSAEEYAEMKLHPTIGAKIISNLPNSKKIISGVKYHHEKWDGTGYPEGLKGENIPFFGRIVSLADAFDAMVSGRSYSGFMDETLAIERLHEEAELFDPEILKAFTRAYEDGSLTIKTSTKSKKPDSQD